jgi:hypothetical protein
VDPLQIGAADAGAAGSTATAVPVARASAASAVAILVRMVVSSRPATLAGRRTGR